MLESNFLRDDHSEGGGLFGVELFLPFQHREGFFS
jgi:hypothetical protein